MTCPYCHVGETVDRKGNVRFVWQKRVFLVPVEWTLCISCGGLIVDADMQARNDDEYSKARAIAVTVSRARKVKKALKGIKQ